MIGQKNLNVFIAEIIRITIDKAVIPAFNSIGADSVAGQKTHLHTIVGKKQMSAAFHDLMRGIVKKIIRIEFKNMIG